ncbi:exonuclease [Hydrococcus rivularis NIES-593]|uniref:Exonuclease n=1 Tax=Hydrococcus rivularis NIES-593 TaxID=1921803 RepID=A0A1U7HMV6_9CYAN|nr:exonuclease [Hydrococcus rivularis]OKH24916.1 exonuclease [Hydrococcus rivularis NIES-593]
MLLPPLQVKSLRQNGSKYYVDARGIRFPSVSTILNATKPQAERDRLFNWRQRLGTEEAKRVSTTTSRRGTKTHQYIKSYLQGEDLPCSDTSLPYWESIKPVLENIDLVKLIESPIVHYDLSYAGIVDCVASYKGVPCVCEWKTADKPKGSLERLFDFPLQLIAYLGAVNSSYENFGIELDRALLVVAIPNMPAEVFWFEKAEIDFYWQQWKGRVNAYRSAQAQNK